MKINGILWILYIGDFANIYNEYLILNTSEFLPLYYNNASIDETEYFEVYDAFGNYYHMNSHLNSEILDTGIYNLTWNSEYNDYYYTVYQSPEEYEESLHDLYEYYNPHVDKFRYLYLTWADEDSWKEWHTLQQPNINIDTLEITFEWYNEDTEEFESIIYNQTLNEFIARNIAVEYLYPYDRDSQTANFTLSQDYSNAQDLGIQSIKGYFFNESGNDFDLEGVNIYAQEKVIEISAPNGFNLSDFEIIIVLLNFTGGAYSDYTQFKMLDYAICNHPEVPLWTKNDSFYVDFDYYDLDYFLLMEDYAVGSEDSMFEYFEYTRNLNFAHLDAFNTYLFDPSSEIQVIDFENFTKVNDPATVLELHDFDQNCEHELVIQKDDITRSGTFDSFKYGFVNSAGEISFHTVIQQATISEKYTEKDGDYKETKLFSSSGRLSQKFILTNTTIERSTTRYTTLIQKDLDEDGILDREVAFETIYNNAHVETITQEIQIYYGMQTDFYDTNWKREIYKDEYSVYRSTFSFVFRDFETGELVETRYYNDAFPNELSEVNNIKNYQQTIINDQDDEDPLNDLVIEAPKLEELLELSHPEDNVSAFFDQRMEIIDGEIISENLLSAEKSMSLPRANPYLDGLEEAITLEVIEVIPDEGVIFDANPGYNMRNTKDGSYGYFDSDGDSFYETIFVFDEEGDVIGVGFDYDGDKYFTPNRRRLMKQYTYQDNSYQLFSYEDFTLDNHLSLADIQNIRDIGIEEEDGYVLESTFSDSLFDLWKMQYSGGSSKLIKQVRKMTAQQFMKSLTPAKIAGDILWQVASQTVALIASIWTGAIGYLLVYSLLNALYSYLQQKRINNYIKQHTFYSAEYEGKETLSDKWWADRYYGDVMTTALFDIGAGVYTPIKIQTDKHIYEGEVLLAPKAKTSIDFDFDVSFSSSATNYALQTRGYQLYSDYGDPRLTTYFCEKFGINPTYSTFGLTLPIMPSESKYASNNIMYLESAISKATEENDDVQYDAIYPYYMYQVPMLQFGQSLGDIPMPEFYEEYPIFVSPEKYEQVQNKVHTIYKVYEAETPEIHITAEDSVHILHSDVKSIDIYLVGKSNPSSIIPECYEKVAEDVESFTFDMMTGILTFDDEIYSDVLKPTLNVLKQEYEDIEDFESYYVLEIKVEKYHSIEDLEGLDEDEVKKIAYMQSIQEAIHEYIYQYTIAQQTQQKLCEIAYTAFITAISTAITLPVGIAVGGMKVASKGVNIWTQIVSNPAGEISRIAFGSLVGLYVAKAIVSEVCQEIFLDPWIEATVENFVADAGLGVFWQTLASGLAEGAREAGLGPVFNAFRASSADTNLQSQQIYEQEQLDPQLTGDLATEFFQQYYKQEYSVSLKSFATSSVMLFGAAMLGMLLPGIGSAIGAGLTAMVVVCQTDDNINIKKGLSRIVDSIRSKKTPFTHNMYLTSEEWDIFDISNIQWESMNRLSDSSSFYHIRDYLINGELMKNSIELMRYCKYADPMDNYIYFMQRALQIKAGMYLDDIVEPPDKIDKEFIDTLIKTIKYKEMPSNKEITEKKLIGDLQKFNLLKEIVIEQIKYYFAERTQKYRVKEILERIEYSGQARMRNTIKQMIGINLYSIFFGSRGYGGPTIKYTLDYILDLAKIIGLQKYGVPGTITERRIKIFMEQVESGVTPAFARTEVSCGRENEFGKHEVFEILASELNRGTYCRQCSNDAQSFDFYQVQKIGYDNGFELDETLETFAEKMRQRGSRTPNQVILDWVCLDCATPKSCSYSWIQLYGCKVCSSRAMEFTMEDAIKAGKRKGLELAMSEKEFEDAKDKMKNIGRNPCAATLLWSFRGSRRFPLTYNYVLFKMPNNLKYKRVDYISPTGHRFSPGENHVRLVFQKIFGGKFDHTLLKDIVGNVVYIDGQAVEIHSRSHVDGYDEIQIEGKVFRIVFEFWEMYFHSQSRIQDRDLFKKKIFDNREDIVFIILTDNDLTMDFEKIIAKQFKEQTGISIPYERQYELDKFLSFN